MKRAISVLGLLAAPAAAWGFCGTYVGGAGTEIYNNVSEVAYVRDGDRTTLTLYSDVAGDTDDFAMIVPVPEVIGADNLHTVDAELFRQLDQYSSPRRVRYDCEDFRPAEADVDTDTDADSDTDTDWNVEVEAEYVVGEYSVVILSSGDAGDLQGWLDQHGYAMPADERGILQSYIDAESYFLAARLNDDEELPPSNRLSPLQFSYEASSEMMSLPIRIGTLSAGGVQDVIIYAMNPYADGRMAISNYTEAELEESCMWQPEGEHFNDEAFASFYTGQLEAAYAEHGAFWTTEYAWGGGKCDPCEGPAPDPSTLLTFGMSEEDASSFNLFFTRLHARYAPEEATQDLMLYSTGLFEQSQQRYIDYVYELESRFPICDLGIPVEPGTCDFDEEEEPDDHVPDHGHDDEPEEEEEAGCLSGGGGLAGVMLVGLTSWRRRRRRRGQ